MYAFTHIVIGLLVMVLAVSCIIFLLKSVFESLNLIVMSYINVNVLGMNDVCLFCFII